MSTFNLNLKKIILETKRNLCVGLDPDIELLPQGYQKRIEGVYEFLKDIIDFTYEHSISYKLNIAFYESFGVEGWILLNNILNYFNDLFIKTNQKKILIADAKRGDIGNTSEKYAKAFFEVYNFDAITLHPYMGYDSIKPFIKYKHKGSIILCLTSNPSNVDFEFYGNPHLYEIVANKIKEWNQEYDNVMAVIGATNSEIHIERLSHILQEIPVLVPGIGSQGGDLEIVMKYFKRNAIINIGRSIMYASSERNHMQQKIIEYLVNYYNKIYKFF